MGATPVTYLLLGANVVVWLALEAAGGSQDPTVLFRFGAKFGPAIADGEYWRLFVPIFLHIGFFHLLTNSIGLLIFGRIVESLFGSVSFAAIYLLAGVLGNVASYAAGPTLGAGASGAVFGIVGAYGAYMILNRRTLKQMGGSSLGGLGLLVLINLVFGFSIAGIDNWAHLGGLAGGFAIALRLTPRAIIGHIGGILVRVPVRRAVPVVALAVAAIALMTWTIGRDYPYSPSNIAETQLAEASRSMEAGDYNNARRSVARAVQIDRELAGLGTATLYLIYGLEAAEAGRDSQAVRDLETAVRWGLLPRDEELAVEALRQMGVGQ